MSHTFTRMDLPHRALTRTTATEWVEAFVELLQAWGVGIKPGSSLEHGLLLHHQLAMYAARPAGFITADEGREIQEAAGILHLAALMLRQSSHPSFPAILPHLELLNVGSPSQTVPSPYGDQASNKIFELYVALAAMAHGGEVTLDHPVTSSRGLNPDVLATMSDGLRWGFACKVLHGEADLSLYDNIAKGISQLRAAGVQRGAVVISMRNRILHNRLLGIDEEANPEGPVRAMAGSMDVGRWITEHIDLRMHRMRRTAGSEALQELVGEDEWVVCVHAPASFFVLTPGGMASTFMAIVRPFELGLFAVGAPNLFLRREKALVLEQLIDGFNVPDPALLPLASKAENG